MKRILQAKHIVGYEQLSLAHLNMGKVSILQI